MSDKTVPIPNLRHLRVFLEVAKCHSISQAAPKVFLSQPAITQALAKLERQLDTSLFERQSDGMYINVEGKVYFNRVSRCMEHIEQGLKEAIRKNRDEGGCVSKILPQLTTTQLRALMAVSDVENFTVASRNIGVSQSSLHRAARELEHLMGVTLFEKTNTGISTTKAAKSLSTAAKLGFNEITQAYSEISALQSREVGKIIVGSMPLARTSILPQAINQFTEQHPNVQLDILDAPYHDLLNHLRHGELDFLLGALRFPAPADDILQEELISPPLTVVGRQGHPLENEPNITLALLAQYPWVVPRRGAPTRDFFDSLFTDQTVADQDSPFPTNVVETTSQILIRELLLGSDRLTLISSHQIERERSLGLLRIFPYELNHTRRPIGITVRKNWQPTPAQQSFLTLLRQAADAYKY
ncbi:LysR family transcriptional regulator [Vibrio mangrovi]|uniref:HTH-type transcriptional activator CmpR n=1 Tax=Vibrio mangrovi TaxID=474394 RepID=A0A1Y6J2K4_9VIBR|nr:LysR family transcriptional regulator [Vibrio mangrovi]MDW6005246.1 LysR family transcriptional regulator [Vibrio mangrovi]SMS02543.1 HTH-type transcriptional activator CmpR [Vibrio mangrovi]